MRHPRRSVFGQLVARPWPGSERRLGKRIRLPSRCRATGSRTRRGPRPFAVRPAARSAHPARAAARRTLSRRPPGVEQPLVRPYAFMTGGRTRPRYQLAIEALVHTTRTQPHQMQGQLPEHQRICNLCREISRWPRSRPS